MRSASILMANGFEIIGYEECSKHTPLMVSNGGFYQLLELLLKIISNPYALKEGGGEMSAWTSAGLQPSGGYYPYDPTLAAYG
ncbi:hypothetical protein HF086_000187 [Spodoptera exigua]|uniref:Uncharacterized protein n=1 Tax=Spodoptera exigua TaxID=7107 RepID=A0A922M145_SPOEX|nr:hypothetical protein HF086_000187 [Spodoptera exigua]